MLSPYRYNSAATGSMTSGKALLITGGGSGGGTVTSVNETLAKDATETISGGPIVGAGTLARTAVDAGSDKIIFWDDSADSKAYLALGTNLSITGTTINAAGSVSSVDQSLAKDDTETLTGGPITGSGTLARTGVDAGSDKLVFWDDSADKKTYLTVGSGLSITGTTISATASGLTIDSSPISSGTANRILFESSTNKLSEDSGFTYDAAANAMDIGTIRIEQTGIISNPTVAGNGITIAAGRAGILAYVATSSGAPGGTIEIRSGAGGATDDGGNFTIQAGAGGGTSGIGGDMIIAAGSPSDGDGGNVSIAAVDAFGTDHNGGGVHVIVGTKTGAGVSGTFNVSNSGVGAKKMEWDVETSTLRADNIRPYTAYKSVDGSTGATGSASSANVLTIKNGLVTNIA